MAMQGTCLCHNGGEQENKVGILIGRVFRYLVLIMTVTLRNDGFAVFFDGSLSRNTANGFRS